MIKKVTHKIEELSCSEDINKSTNSKHKKQKERKTVYLPDSWLLDDEYEQSKPKRKKKNKF